MHAAGRQSDDALELSHLLELHEASKAFVDRSDLDAYDNFNREFHEAIYAATHNAFLAEQALAIRVRLRAFRRTSCGKAAASRGRARSTTGS